MPASAIPVQPCGHQVRRTAHSGHEVQGVSELILCQARPAGLSYNGEPVAIGRGVDSHRAELRGQPLGSASANVNDPNVAQTL